MGETLELQSQGLTCSRAEKANGRRRLSKSVVAVLLEISGGIIIKCYLDPTDTIGSDIPRESTQLSSANLLRVESVSKLIVQLIDIALHLRRASWCGFWRPVLDAAAGILSIHASVLVRNLSFPNTFYSFSFKLSVLWFL